MTKTNNNSNYYYTYNNRQQHTILTMLSLLLLCAPLVKTTAFSSQFVVPRGGGVQSGPLRGGTQQRLHDLRRRRKQPWRLQQSSMAVPLGPNNSTAMAGQELLNPTTENTAVLDAPVSEAVIQGEEDDDDTAMTNEKPFFQRIEGIVFMSYLCNVMTLSLPVLLVPIAASEQAATAALSTKAASAMVAAQVAKISSVASLGGAIGKFVNGFICKELGPYFCSKTYLAGLGLCSLAFSFTTNPSVMSYAFAGMEFFASIQWASLAVMLSNYYAKQPVKLAAALTALGLSSTSGQILAKTFGMTLSSALHWRTVAQLGALVAFGGAALISRAPGQQMAAQQQANKVPFQWKSVTDSLKAVLGSRLFLVLGLAHAMAFVARGTDRILSVFYHEMAGGLSQAICGGLTLSITLGLVQGLVSGSKKFGTCADLSQKRTFLKKRYIATVAATFGLMALSKIGSGGAGGFSRFLMPALVAIMSGIMASNISFQYFQFPAMIAQKYGDHKAVVISFLDGFGFLLSAPIFATIGRVVPTMGWSAGWSLLGGLFGAAALLMMSSINPILKLTQTPAEKEQQELAAKTATTTTTETTAINDTAMATSP